MKKNFLSLLIIIFFITLAETKSINVDEFTNIITMDINLKKVPYMSKKINLSKFLIGKKFTIDWGDGTITNRKKHLYRKRNEYTIKIYLKDINQEIGLKGCRKSLNLALSLDSIYINEGIKWKSLKNGFSYCGDTNITFKNPDFSSITNLKGLFSRLSDFKGGEWIKRWDVSNITNMKKMFFLSKEFNQDISQWNVSNVTNMKKMFWYAKSFNQNLGSWDVSNVTNMRKMFNRNLSTKNYSSTLTGWSKLSLQNGVNLGAYHIKYNLSGGYAKQQIINNYDWKIHDGGLEANCTYTTAEGKCIQVEMDESKLNLYLKHEDNDIVQIEHIIYPDYGAKIRYINFVPSPNGSYYLLWTSYCNMRDDLIRMTRFDSNGVELVPTKSLLILGHLGYNPDITLLKNDNFLLHWCTRGSPRLRLFDNYGNELNAFTHSSVSAYHACRNRMNEPAIIIPLDDGGFNYSFGDYNNTFDNQGNPL